MPHLPRRHVLAAGFGAAALPAWAQGASSAPPRPMHLLILGGTGFVGPHQVRYALSRGHKVTLFNRGRRPKEWPAEVEELTGDRDTNDYASLKGRRFDVCIDNPSAVPHWVRDAAAVLKSNVAHHLFISTVSVYADNAQVGADESAERERYTGPDRFAETMASLRKNMALYGPLKAACEDEVIAQYGAAHSAIVRPGLIVGPGDETDRFTYWPLRVQRGGPTLVPPRTDPVRLIDARDLAEWTIRLAEARATGAYNALGPTGNLTMGEMLDTLRSALGSKAEWVEASAEWLEKEKVSAWGDLPVWIPGQGETAGFHRRSNARAVAAGLTFRPLADTGRDTVAWWQGLDEKRRTAPLRAGLAPAREAELLQRLRG
ncbi:NAD-dependent epimerase/dehydratase family protein [Inhella crocodyli]|uniref:NAD-dependent epimerase/dehydratase family protein n=1 Tax=Inhella crocodyli TaxID=2499851 RepID=A0A3S2UDI0_9BURK|nr:NAD-dependent epimerase/dehydratase family protein [Inhella crocodyli]RVT82917.1 NAD-dependent epimerase/dehydratase family protein [Inhella crocodyli]